MRIILLCMAMIVLAGCEATAVNSAADIKTKLKLNQNFSEPVQLPVAYYVSKWEPENKVNFYGRMEDAIQLVSEEMFSSSEKVTSESDFAYLLKVKTSSNWDSVWGGWENDVELQIVDRDGNIQMQKNISKKASGSGGLYDINAVYNAFAAAIKDLLIEFFNTNTEQLLAREANFKQSGKIESEVPIKSLFDSLEPSNSGSGFFINNEGFMVTAAHVVNQCIFVEMHHKGVSYDVSIEHFSRLLDLAVLKADYTNEVSVIIEEEPNISLGKQIFVTGYPLSGILSAYPSLTIGNISSKGGLKGAQGYFQFSAPIQPGNSGGAITDYKGNLMGVVSSTLNQAMMLEKSGTTSQNVNFGIETPLLKRFLDKFNVTYNQGTSDASFETSSTDAVEYSNQILCYQ